MVRYSLICSALALNLAACGTAPFDAPLDERGRPTVNQIIDRVDCEIYTAFGNSNNEAAAKALGTWVAAVEITLTVSDTEGLTPSGGLALAFSEPLKTTGTSFGFGGSPVLYQTRTRTYDQKYTITNVRLIKPEICSKWWHADFNLEGDLGLADQIYAGLHSVKNVGSVPYNTNTGFGATVSFDISKGVSGVGPTWTLVRFKDAAGGLGLSRDDTHKVAITFTPSSAPPLGPAQTTNIYVVQQQLLNAISQTINRF
jgi:hypothetical protein